MFFFFLLADFEQIPETSWPSSFCDKGDTVPECLTRRESAYPRQHSFILNHIHFGYFFPKYTTHFSVLLRPDFLHESGTRSIMFTSLIRVMRAFSGGHTHSHSCETITPARRTIVNVRGTCFDKDSASPINLQRCDRCNITHGGRGDKWCVCAVHAAY